MACILSMVSALRAQDQQTSVAVLARKSVDGTVVSVSVIGASLPRNHDAMRLARSAISQSLLRRSLVQMSQTKNSQNLGRPDQRSAIWLFHKSSPTPMQRLGMKMPKPTLGVNLIRKE